MADIFEENYRCYGYRRLHAMLRGNNRVISEKVVRRLMAEEQLVVKRTRRRRYNSYCGEIGPAPENLLARDFSSCRPNEKWLTDITEFQLPAGKVYLSPVIDCFDGQVVSWSIGTRPDATLVNTMLDDALDTLNEHDKPVDTQRSWWPLPVAGLARAYQHLRTYKVHVAQRMLVG